jgi:dCMP deaminase
MDTAWSFARRATCPRLSVGAVLVQDDRVVSVGYNGAPAGMDHCPSDCVQQDRCVRSVHAEANAILWAAKVGTATHGAHLYTTHAPCYHCAQLAINAGVAAVVYDTEYRSTEGIDLLNESSVFVFQIEEVKYG